ncbi:MAG: hypothetical protein ACREXU_06515, partial [Gammaproteobacteria bacterium]
FTAQAQAAEAVAAEYRALAENPLAAQIATHYLYDPEGRLLGEYDQAGHVERECVYLDHLPSPRSPAPRSLTSTPTTSAPRSR